MILQNITINFAIAICTMTLMWLIFLWIRNPSVVDLGWAIGLTAMGLTHNLWLNLFSPTNLFISFMIFLWGVRLAGYLLITRIIPGIKDPRYENLQQESSAIPRQLFFLLHYYFQACFQTVVGFVFIFTSGQDTQNSLFHIVGALLWFIAFIGSIISDAQLYRFRSDPDNKGKVCMVGLWNYSRHPNYFFEILIWVAFALYAMPNRFGLLGLISPLAIYLTMRFITGPISERQSLRSKKEQYSHYQQKTPMIIPWFK